MLQSHPAGDALVGLEGNHLREQIDRRLVHILDVTGHWYAFPLGEGRLKVRILEGFGPVCLAWGALDLKDFEDLVDFGVTDEKGFPLSHLGKNTSDRPNVNRRGILLGTKQNFWCPVPERHDLMRVGLEREPEAAG